jgi:hypothetical protein
MATALSPASANFPLIKQRQQATWASAFGALDEAGQRGLHDALLELIAKFDRGGGDSLVLPADYLEAVLHRA